MHDHTNCEICAQKKKYSEDLERTHAERIVKAGEREVNRLILKYLRKRLGKLFTKEVLNGVGTPYKKQELC